MQPGTPPHFESIIDSIAVGIFCVDTDGICTYCNSHCLHLLGYDSKEALLGKQTLELIFCQEAHNSQFTESAEESPFQFDRREDQVLLQEAAFCRKDGKRISVEFRSHPVHENGSLTGAVISFRDVSLARLEATHRAHLAGLVESSHDAILGRDVDGKITSWNQGAASIYGYSAEEALEQTIRDLILLPGQEVEEPEIRQAIQDGVELTQFAVKRSRKDGTVIDISLTISPVFSTDNELVGYSSVERDITETRRFQDMILQAMNTAEQAEEMANRANRSRAEFLANVSHELRTPMNAILGMLNLALEESLDPVIADYLSVARSSADSLLELVNELLDFAKIESGKFEISSHEFKVREVVESAARTLAPRASEKGLEILCAIESGVPAHLIGDSRRIQQVLTNLLGNAVKFTETGEVVVEVKLIRNMPNESRLRFAVRDTGIGIAEKDQQHILLPFQQADMSSTRPHHGTGLGLSICCELVSLMGGKLQLQSKINQGSTFWFDLSLPVSDGSTPADQVPTSLLSEHSVLIVDDNPTNLRILEGIFVSWSMQPVVSSDAAQAMRVLEELASKEQQVSFVLVDCLMPGMDGFEFANRLHSQSGAQCPPVVMMQSAADLALHSERKLDAPVARYLTKPISQTELLDTVMAVLDLYPEEDSRTEIGAEFRNPLDSPFRSLRVLLVEDLLANQKVAKTILEKRGHRVDTANNGRNAIEMLAAGEVPFDVILMDVQMPVMDGLQATAAIRAMEDAKIAQVPIIAMTAHAMQGDRETCLAAGMDAYLTKPLDARRLVEITESIAESPKNLNGDSANRDLRVSVNDSNDQQTDPEFMLIDVSASLTRLGGDESLLCEFVEIFLDDSPGLMRNIEVALECGDNEELEQAAHALKGLMSNFGASPCCDLMAAMEKAGREKNVENRVGDWSNMQVLYRDLCLELKQLQKQLGGE